MKEQTGSRMWTCISCGHAWLGTESTCPACKSFGKAGDEEFTKKIVEPPDLKKGG